MEHEWRQELNAWVTVLPLPCCDGFLTHVIPDNEGESVFGSFEHTLWCVASRRD